MLPHKLLGRLPLRVRSSVEKVWDAAEVLGQVGDPRVLRRLAPSAARALFRDHSAGQLRASAHHEVFFDFEYSKDNDALARLYERGKELQWQVNNYIHFSTGRSLLFQQNKNDIDLKINTLTQISVRDLHFFRHNACYSE